MLGDHQGTIRDIVDDTGTLRKHTDYDSFGNVTNEQTYGAAVDQAFYWQGEFRDKTTSLQKHGQRWYDPALGRWLSEDPLGFDAGDPNLYRYAGNGPLNYIDPTGTTQAGNPLTSLARSLANSSTPLITQSAKPFSGTSLPGTRSLPISALGSALGNSVYQVGAGLVSSSTLGTIGAAINYATTDTTPRGSYGPIPSTLNPQVVADLRNQGRVTEPALDVLSIRYSDSLGNDKKALVERHISGRGKALPGQIRTTYDIINTAPIYVQDNDLAEIVLNNRTIRSIESAVGAANLGTGITPYVSDARDAIEFKTGRDAITQERLTPRGRFLTGVGLALPVIGGVLLRKAFGLAGASSSSVVNTGSNAVYRSLDEAGNYNYVGLTNNLERRAAAQLRDKGIQIQKLPGLATLSRSDGRAVEQVLIETFGLGKNGGTLLNQINSIAKSNPQYTDAVIRGTQILKTVGFPGF